MIKFVTLIAALIISACTTSTVEKSFSLEELEAASCTTNFVPGRTSDSELLAALQACQQVDKDKISFSRNESLSVSTYAWVLTTGVTGFADMTKQTVVSLNFVTRRGITLGDILANYGAPEFVDRSEGNNPHDCVAVVWLLYPRHGFDTKIAQEYPCDGDLDPTPNLYAKGYRRYAPAPIEIVMRTVYFYDETAVNRAKSSLRNWTGFESMKRK